MAGLGTNKILPAADAADYHLGVYTATEGVFIDPQENSGLTGWSGNTLTLAYYEKKPYDRPGGSIGDV